MADIRVSFTVNPATEGQIINAVNSALESAAIFLQNETKSRVPVDTGNLKGSMLYAVQNFQMVVFTPIEYAIPLEFSTKKPRRSGTIPFMRPALFENKSEIENIIANIMRARI